MHIVHALNSDDATLANGEVSPGVRDRLKVRYSLHCVFRDTSLHLYAKVCSSVGPSVDPFFFVVVVRSYLKNYWFFSLILL